MSGLPGLATPQKDGGLGFNFRMAMGVPDFWIKLIKEYADEQWDVGNIFHQLTSKRLDEKVVSYAESHDQALVGDKTIIFRLIDKEMYFSMRKDQPNMAVDRGIALHKMIRLATLSCAGGAYLNFMGNEFGHPEWIDFPREGNGWSYAHARRLWSLVDDNELRFHWLADFDKEMVAFARNQNLLAIPEVRFHPTQSLTDYRIPSDSGSYEIIIDTDNEKFGGQNRIDCRIEYLSHHAGNNNHYLMLYLPARTAIVLGRKHKK
jgi:1,4-alpha-glucan branching enzyme